MKARRLRTQLTLGMLIFFVGAFGFIYGGTRTLDAWLISQYQNSLPPAAQRAGRALEALRLPDPSDLRVLKEASDAGHAQAQLYSDLGLGVLTVLAACLALWLARVVGQRLARPIERVAQAARRVAHVPSRAATVAWNCGNWSMTSTTWPTALPHRGAS